MKNVFIGKHKRDYYFRMYISILFFEFFLTAQVFAQQKAVTGVVTDESGDPLTGVSVSLKNTSAGTITDINGNYRIQVGSAKDILVFSYIGYITVQEVPGNRSLLNIKLAEDTKLLNEVVVVGYGTQKRSDLTGSVVSVKADDMNAIPTTSVAEMLRGQAAGVVITQNSARPGGSSDILIRGKRSIRGGNNPLFIVDGVPVDNIDDFNSQDIQSVEVLKDASSQSIYGARASNGVILVTTKKASENKTSVDFSAYAGSQQFKRNFDFYSGDEWIQYKREANRSYPGGEYLDDASLFGNMYQNLVDKKYTDWESLMIKPAIQQKYDLSVRSGNADTKILTSIGYFDQQGMIQPAAYNRTTFRFNAEHKLAKHLTIGLNSGYTQSNRSQEDESFSKFITQSPLLSPYDDHGELVDILGDSKWNPAWNNQNMTNEKTSRRLLMNFTLDWEILKGLKYRLNASMDSRNSEQGTYLNSVHEKGSTTNGKATIDIDQDIDYLIENIFTFEREINDENNFDITFVQSANPTRATGISMTGYGFTTDDLGYNNIGAATKTDPINRNISPRNLLSYMGRLRYDLKSKYLFSASARIDGSTVFGKNNKWGFFPAASFGWRISEEEFLRDFDPLTNLKLRLSYGNVGNQAISPYQSQGLVNSYFMQFGTDEPLIGYLPGSQLYNPDLKWETTSSFNSGIDFGFFKDRISGSVEFYNSVTKDLLWLRELNSIKGYDSQLVNIGSVLNRGIELSLYLIPVKTQKLTWSVNLNFAKNHNEILELDGGVDKYITDRLFVGHSIDTYYDYAFDGICQTGEEITLDYGSVTVNPGDIKVKDSNHDESITPEDRIIIDRSPKWTGSIGSTLKWQGIDFSFDFYTVQGVIKQNDYLYDSNSGGDLHGKLNGIKVDYWTPENPSNTAPRPRDATISYFSSLSYQDASYIRLRNLSLGYSFDKKLIKSLRMSNLRFYISATNVWTLTDFLSYSPEVSAGGYPEPSTFIAGLNVSF